MVLAIGFSAFTVYEKAEQEFAGEKWFVFNGTSPMDLNNPNKYSLDGNGASPTVCEETHLNYRCEIYAVPQSGTPVIPNLATIVAETKRAIP